MKKVFLILSICVLAGLSFVGVYFGFFHQDLSSNISRIGIGGGGAFFNPMIDPTDEDVFYVTSDMGAIYYSYNQGKTWDRTESRGVFTQTHISESGVVFCGGYGVYASFDKAQTLNLIYPQDVKCSVSRAGWNENLMLAPGYDNGYVKCITSNSSCVFFCNNQLARSFKSFQKRL